MDQTDDRPALLSLPPIRALLVLTLFGFTGFFLTLSSLPLHAVSVGVPEALAGLPTTVLLAATVLTQLGVPRLMAAAGRPTTLAIGLVALGAPAPLLLVNDGLWWLLADSAIRGIGFGILTVLSPLLATAAVPPSRHGSAIGLYGLAVALPNLVAIPASVALTGAGRFDLVAWFAVAPLLALPLVGRFATPTAAARPGGDGAAAGAKPVDDSLPRGRLTAILALLLSVTLAGGGLLAILPVQVDPGLASAGLVVMGLVAALARWSVGVLSDRRPMAPLLLGGAVCGVLGLALVAGAVHGDAADRSTGLTVVLVLLGAAVFGVSYGAVQNLTLVGAFRLAGRSRETTVSAAWNATYDTGTAIGALLVGALAASFGLAVALVVCVVLVAAVTAPAVLASRRARDPG